MKDEDQVIKGHSLLTAVLRATLYMQLECVTYMIGHVTIARCLELVSLPIFWIIPHCDTSSEGIIISWPLQVPTMSLHTEVSYSHFLQYFIEGLYFLHLLLVVLWQVLQGLGVPGRVVLSEPSNVDHSFVNTFPCSQWTESTLEVLWAPTTACSLRMVDLYSWSRTPLPCKAHVCLACSM